MENETHKSATLQFAWNNENKNLKIVQEETTDGVPFYAVEADGQVYTQVRKDENSQWKQIWGKADEAEVEALGKEIDGISDFSQ